MRIELRLSKVEWDVLVLDHVLDLFSHRCSEEDDEVKQKNWPEDWNVQEGEESANEGNQEGFCGREPDRERELVRRFSS